MKNKAYIVAIAALSAVALAAAVLYYLPWFAYSTDKAVDELVGGVLIRGAVSALLILLAIKSPDKHLLVPDLSSFWKNLLVGLPCFAVAVVNFPFSALISGFARVERLDLIWLFALNCILIGVTEEVFFRGILQSYIAGLFKKSNYDVVFTVAVTSAVFALWHLFNLFSSGFGAVAFQITYTFLIGAMLSVTILMTKSVWLCVAIHALFDFGGAIVSTLGSGNFQDDFFWASTIAVGLAVGAYIIMKLVDLQKKSNEQKNADNGVID